MKVRIVPFFLSFILLVTVLSSCLSTGENAAQPTIENIFTLPETDSETPPSTALTIEEWKKTWPEKVGGSLGFAGQYTEGMEYKYYVYDGGELHAQIDLQTTGMSEIGTGVLIFLDGRPQPYRLADCNEYSYMHTFYQEDSVRTIHDIYLIPVTGQAGDTLEMQIMCVTWPDYFLDQGRTVAQHTAGTTGSSVLLVMEATPEAQSLPSIPDKLVSFSVEYQDLTAGEIEGWTAEQIRNESESHYALNGKIDGGNIYNFQGSDSIEFQYEIWGNTAGNFGFVLFVDNQPISVDPSDAILFTNQNGKKTMISMELDLSDFDGSSVIYGVLLGRNHLSNGIGNGASESFRETWVPYYLSDAQDIYDLMGWEENE